MHAPRAARPGAQSGLEWMDQLESRIRRMFTGFPLAIASAVLLSGAAADLARAAPSRPARVVNFALLDQQGRFRELYEQADAAAVVLFVQGNGCPISRNAVPALRQLREEFAARGVRFWMLNANPQDPRDAIAREAAEFGIDFPILVDESQLVAQSLGVTRTAEAIVIDPARWQIVYRGPVDDRLSYETQKPAAHRYLRDALAAQLAGETIPVGRRESNGCLITFPPRAPAADSEISYAEQVAPLLMQNCRSCHQPQGVAPWAMTDYAAVFGWSAMMREVILTRRMPPWHADPKVQRYANDIALAPEEARLLVGWIDAGAPRGGGADPLVENPPPARVEWPLGEPDLVLEAPVQEILATGVVEYRYEEVAVPLARDVWIRAADVRPTNPRVMHHATAYIRYPEGREPQPTLGPRFTRGLFTGYVPGREPRALPNGSGYFLPAGSSIRFELHYTTIGRPETDTLRIGLYLSREPLAHDLKIGAAANFDFAIPPGAAEFEADAVRFVDRDILIYELAPHMHYRGKRMSIEARYPDGSSELLVSVPNYNFNWQRRYVFAEPKTLPAGTRIVAHAAFDNSAGNPANPDPTAWVRFGRQSFEEMLFGYFLYRELEPGELEARLASAER